VIKVILSTCFVGAALGWAPAKEETAKGSGDRARKSRAEGFTYPKEAVGYRYTVLGVADLTGRTPRCWDTAGHTDSHLTRLVTEAVQKGEQPRARILEGRKNRYLIVSLTIYPKSGADPMVADRIEDDPAGVNSLALSSFKDGREPFSAFTTVSAMPFSADEGQRTGTFTLLRTVKLPPTRPFKLFPGSGPDLSDRKLVYTGFQRGTTREIPRITASHGEWWTLEFDCSQPVDDPAEYYLTLFDHQGKTVTCSDVDGRPVPSAVFAAERNREIKAGTHDPMRPFGNRFRIPAPGGNASQDGRVKALVSVDPTQIGEIRVDAYVREEIEISGIPLDPVGVSP